METFDCVAKRVSIREYQARPIDKNLIEKLVDAARRAPSARAVEPWEFVVIENRQMLQRLSRLIPNGPFLKEAACCIVIFCKQTKYYLEDGCAATENILLCAADIGLGACWIAGDKKDYAPKVVKLLKADKELKLISLISLGWPKQEKQQAKTRSLADLIHWESF